MLQTYKCLNNAVKADFDAFKHMSKHMHIKILKTKANQKTSETKDPYRCACISALWIDFFHVPSTPHPSSLLKKKSKKVTSNTFQ